MNYYSVKFDHLVDEVRSVNQTALYPKEESNMKNDRANLKQIGIFYTQLSRSIFQKYNYYYFYYYYIGP